MSKKSAITYDELASTCPMTMMARLRAQCPVVAVDAPLEAQQGFLVSRAADIAEIGRHPQKFSSMDNPQSDRWGDYNAEVAAVFRSEGWPLARTLVWIDPPEHARFRKLVDKIFLPSRVAAREEHISICIGKLLDRMPLSGEIDGVAQFAATLPAMVMTREFNAPEDDFQILIDTTNTIANSTDFTRNDPADNDRMVVEAAHAITRFQNYMMPRIEAVRANPTNTMLSELVHATNDDGTPALSIEELHSVLIIFLIAATHSTTGGIAWALHSLAEFQDVQARLRAEPDKIPNFLEETLRFHGVVQTSYRTTTEDVTIDGVDIPARSQVFLRWDSANFDEDKWEDPTRFDIDRKGVRNHMTFGTGIHFCVGNTLARKEMAMSVSAFLARYSAITFAAKPDLLESVGIHALNTLPLAVTAA